MHDDFMFDLVSATVAVVTGRPRFTIDVIDIERAAAIERHRKSRSFSLECRWKIHNSLN